MVLMNKSIAYASETFISWFVSRVLVRKTSGTFRAEELEAFVEAFPEDPKDFFTTEHNTLPPENWFRKKSKKKGLVYGDFSFPSDEPIGEPKNDQVHGVALLHPKKEKSPHVIFLHGWITPFHHQSVRFAKDLAKSGYSTYMMELPYHMRRTPPGRFSGIHMINADPRILYHGIRQAIADVQKLIRALRAQGVESIHLAGLSMGAHICGIASAIQEDIDSLLLIIPVSDYLHTILHAPILKSSREILKELPVTSEELQRFFAPLELTRYQPLVPSDKILIVNGVYDRIVFSDKVRHLWKVWGLPSLLEVPHSHVSLFFSQSPFKLMAQHLKQHYLPLQSG